MVKIAIVRNHDGHKSFIDDIDGNPQTWPSEEDARKEISLFNKTNGLFMTTGDPINFKYVIEKV